MNKKGTLFFLIKSLTKSEKRYFKLYCANEKINANYLKLFDTYEGQEELSDEFVKNKFQGERFIKQLHVTKIYLYELIMKSLRSYHLKISKDAEIKNLIRDVEILYTKELYDQCQFAIQKAEKIARTYEKNNLLLELLGWKRKLQLTLHGTNAQLLNEIISEEKRIVGELELQCEYWSHAINIFKHIRNKKTWEKFKLNPLFRKDAVPQVFQTKILYYHLQYSIGILSKDIPHAMQSINQLIEEIESYPDRIKDDPSSYVTSINNKITLLIRSHEYDGILPLLSKIRDIPQRYGLKEENKFTLRMLLRSYNIELELYRDTKDFTKGTALIDHVVTFLDKHHKSIPREYFILLWYQFANIYFISKEYHKALKWVNLIMANKFPGGRTDLESYARLMNLMIHFELGNITFLKYAIDNFRRFVKKNKKEEPFIKALLRFFSRISNAYTHEFKLFFQQLYEELFESEEPLVSDNILDYLDFKIWIKNKL